MSTDIFLAVAFLVVLVGMAGFAWLIGKLFNIKDWLG